MPQQCSVLCERFSVAHPRFISVGVCAWALVLLWGAQVLGVGCLERPGPGFFPAGLGGGLGLCGMGLWIWGSPAAATVEQGAVGWRGGVVTGLGVLTFAVIAPWLGWAVATALTLLVMTVGDSRWGWLERGGYALGGAVLGWLLFGWGLGVFWPAWRSPW